MIQSRRLFRAAQEAWDARDRERLKGMVPPDLWIEWERRLDDFEGKGWHNRVEVLGIDSVEYVRLAAWAEAVDGEDAELSALATPGP